MLGVVNSAKRARVHVKVIGKTRRNVKEKRE
jgi:hypothetical protein